MTENSAELLEQDMQQVLDRAFNITGWTLFHRTFVSHAKKQSRTHPHLHRLLLPARTLSCSFSFLFTSVAVVVTCAAHRYSFAVGYINTQALALDVAYWPRTTRGLPVHVASNMTQNDTVVPHLPVFFAMAPNLKKSNIT